MKIPYAKRLKILDKIGDLNEKKNKGKKFSINENKEILKHFVDENEKYDSENEKQDSEKEINLKDGFYDEEKNNLSFQKALMDFRKGKKEEENKENSVNKKRVSFSNGVNFNEKKKNYKKPLTKKNESKLNENQFEEEFDFENYKLEDHFLKSALKINNKDNVNKNFWSIGESNWETNNKISEEIQTNQTKPKVFDSCWNCFTLISHSQYFCCYDKVI